MKRLTVFFSTVLFISMSVFSQDVSAAPSKVSVLNNQLIVEKRNANGSLNQAVPYIIKGVTYSPATRAPAKGPDPLNPGVLTDYGFFFDWPGRNPQGHDILTYWIKNELTQYHAADIALMKQANINTVRVYTDFGTDPLVYNKILDEFYRNDIMVILTVAISIDDLDCGRYLQVVQLYKDHPAILMWSLGNEWNFNKYYDYGKSMDYLISSTNLAAAQIKQLDPNHPVSSCLGDKFDLFYDPGNPCSAPPELHSDIPWIVNNSPNVDIWGINIYRGKSFGNLFSQWKGANQLNSPKPFYISEFGTDSFYTSAYHPLTQCSNLAKIDNGSESQDEQKTTFMYLWDEIAKQLPVLYSDGLCLGGLVHEFNDELWKVGNYNSGLGGLVDYAVDTSYDEYNSEGFVLPGGHPDNVANEEYFGVVDAGRNPKTVFYEIQRSFKLADIFLSPSNTDVKVTLNKQASPSGLTFAGAFTIANNSNLAIGWQLYNNQDGRFTPKGGTVPSPILVQGFGFYESSGGLGAKQSIIIRAYANNNLPLGLYQGSYKLQQILGSKTIDVATIFYSLTVTDINPPVVTITTPQVNSIVSRKGFSFSGTADDISGIAEVRVYVYDARRGYTVNNALASYNSTTKAWVFPVSYTQISSGYLCRLWVRAKDKAGNLSLWQVVAVNVEKALPDLGAYGFLKIGKYQKQVIWNQAITLTPLDINGRSADGRLIFNVTYAFREYNYVPAAGFKNNLLFSGQLVNQLSNISLDAFQIKYVTVPISVLPQNAKLELKIDAGNQIAEAAETNNNFTVYLNFSGF
ncbi:MAG: Ig-like domain-containing protein [Candidatus Omnitrophota bacterium]|nr:Ig-like domain-containing protein [Candidatus Omnitrophota bacterium]